MNLPARQRVLVAHHWPLQRQRAQMFAADEFYLTPHPHQLPNALQLPQGEMDMAAVLKQLPRGWQPDLFVAKVDAFFNLVPRNLAALNCPKVLVLGDSQHGKAPLTRLLQYTQAEAYDVYISDHKRHHLWYFHLAGIRPLYWLPGLITFNPPPADLSARAFDNAQLSQLNWPQVTTFLGQIGQFHPRRQRIVEHLRERGVQNFLYGRLSHQDCYKAYAAAGLSLNVSLNGDLNCRTLEILAAGGLLLADQLSEESGIDLLLEPGRDYLRFAHLDELSARLAEYRANPEAMQACRQSGHRRYTEEFSPAKIQTQFSRIISGAEPEARFSSRSIQRIQHASKTAPLSLQRLRLYEIVQELHRQREWLSVYADADFVSPEDLLDLPRLELSLSGWQAARQQALLPYLDASGQRQRVRWHNQGPEARNTLWLSNDCSPQRLAQLVENGGMMLFTDAAAFARASAEPQWLALRQRVSDAGHGLFLLDVRKKKTA